jgi:hypothetical protein
MTTLEEYAEAVNEFRKKADRNFAVIEDGIWELQNLFAESDARINRILGELRGTSTHDS